MHQLKVIGLLGTAVLAIAACGCKDKDTPSTLADQQKLVRGSTPTPEQLQSAMSKYKFDAPDGKSNPMPPAGAAGNR